MSLELLLGIYGSVVSTTVAVVTVYNMLLRDRPNLRLSAELGFPAGPRAGPPSVYIVCTNKGRRPITVEQVSLRLQDGQLLTQPSFSGELPKRLNEGEHCQIRMELAPVKAELAGKEARAVGIFARDGTGQKHTGKLPGNVREALERNPNL